MNNGEIFNYIDFLIRGNLNYCAKFPQKKSTTDFLKDLKDKGFISKETKIEHFRVLFGVPIQRIDCPFEPIIWIKNGQLLKYFIDNIFPKYVHSTDRHVLTFNLFVNKRGKNISLPNSDRKRLEYSADFPTLKKLLNDFY